MHFSGIAIHEKTAFNWHEYFEFKSQVKLIAKPNRISDKKPLFHHAEFRIIEVVFKLAMNDKLSLI